MGTIADHKAVDENAERHSLRDGRNAGTLRECLVPEGPIRTCALKRTNKRGTPPAMPI
jgi:hypothetical protein